jgi:predicted nucleotidyltransferase
MKHDARAAIDEVLGSLERGEQVRILFACESGSRAWGFESADSDWDVRFLFVRPVKSYLVLDAPADQLERQVDSAYGSLDVVGWDLAKSLRLLRKSNPALIEWFRSPIIYRWVEPFCAEMHGLVDRSFSPKASGFHYGNTARTYFREYLQTKEVRLKRYFYSLRAVLAFEWATGGRGIPPLPLEDLLDELMAPNSPARKDIDDLLKRKRAGTELGTGPPLPAVQAFLAEAIKSVDATLRDFARDRSRPARMPTTEELNDFLRRVLMSSSRIDGEI